MTKESYPETIKAAREFVFNNGGKVSQLLDRFLSAYND